MHLISGRQPLKPGDRILLGQTVLLVEPAEVPPEITAVHPPEPAARTQLVAKPPQARDVIPSRLIHHPFEPSFVVDISGVWDQKMAARL